MQHLPFVLYERLNMATTSTIDSAREQTKKDLFKESIGNGRYLTAAMYRDELMIHIREYESENGKEYPTRRGVPFNKLRWAMFIRHVDDVERSVDLLKANQPVDYRQHIGRGFYISVAKGYNCVDFRRYFMPSNAAKEIPTRRGIALRLSEWEELLTQIRRLQETLPELKIAKPCYSSDDHANQLGQLSCIECNPFGVGLFDY